MNLLKLASALIRLSLGLGQGVFYVLILIRVSQEILVKHPGKRREKKYILTMTSYAWWRMQTAWTNTQMKMHSKSSQTCCNGNLYQIGFAKKSKLPVAATTTKLYCYILRQIIISFY